MSASRVTALAASFVCNVAEHQVPGQRCLDGDLRGLEITNFADHDDIGILAQNRPQRARERQFDPRAHLRLRDAVERVLDRVLDRHHVGRVARQPRQRRVQRRRLARSRGPGDEHDAVRLADQAVDPIKRIAGPCRARRDRGVPSPCPVTAARRARRRRWAAWTRGHPLACRPI